MPGQLSADSKERAAQAPQSVPPPVEGDQSARIDADRSYPPHGLQVTWAGRLGGYSIDARDSGALISRCQRGDGHRAQDIDPDLDILALRFAYLLFGRLGQVRKVAVLDTYQVRFAQCKVEVKVDEAVQRGGRVGAAGPHITRTGEEPGADPDQQLDQQRLLVGEVAVDGRTAD